MDTVKTTIGNRVYFKVNSSTPEQVKSAMLKLGYEIGDAFDVVTNTASVVDFPFVPTRKNAATITAYLKDKNSIVVKFTVPENVFDHTFSRSPKGSRETSGIKFEGVFANDLRTWANGGEATLLLTNELVRTQGLVRGGVVTEKGHSKGTRRPVKIDDSGIYVLSRDLKQQAPIIADVIYTTPERTVYISVKSTSNTKLYNGGIAPLFRNDTTRGIFLQLLGFPVADVERHYNLPATTPSTRKDCLPEFVRATMGSGYVIAHQFKDGKVSITPITNDTTVIVERVGPLGLSDKTCYYALRITIDGVVYNNCTIKLVNQSGKGSRLPNIVYIDFAP